MFFLVMRRPPGSTRSDSRLPYPTRFRSADGEDAGLAGLAGRRVDRQVMLLQRHAPLRDGTEIGLQPEEGEQGVGRQAAPGAIQRGDGDGLQVTSLALKAGELEGYHDLEARRSGIRAV